MIYTATAEDMQELDITSGDLDYETPHTKRAFWEILDKAKIKKVPKKGPNCKLSVFSYQLYAVREYCQLCLGNSIRVCSYLRYCYSFFWFCK